MTPNPQLPTQHRYWHLVGMIFLIILITLVNIIPATAQDDGKVQVIEGHLALGENHLYVVSNLMQGDNLSIYVESLSGNLDPMIGLADANSDPDELRESFYDDLETEIEKGRDPLIILPKLRDEYLLEWDDDNGDGYDSALTFRVPEDGDYILMVSSNITVDSFGDYRLTIAVNTPMDLATGKSTPTGDTIAVLDKSSKAGYGVQQISGTLTEQRNKNLFELRNLFPGEKLYAFVETTSGDLRPVLILKDFGEKPIRSGNITGQDTKATLEYSFDEESRDYYLEIQGTSQGNLTTGDYRLLVGVNAPEVLSGVADIEGNPVVKQPTELSIGIQMDQITAVDQVAENYGAVATLRIDWQDPEYAFSPADCDCFVKIFTVDSFNKFMIDNDLIWPDFVFFNQQGNRWIQNSLIILRSNGSASYLERFSTDFQAPDFNFERYPFDSQVFYMHVDSIYPEDFYVYSDKTDFSGLGEQLGEEEWQVTNYETIITTEDFGSRFSFKFEASRHLNYYLFRIFVPIVLIILVAWITFFLRDYGRRIEVTSGNLLVFVAFNFTISDDLPRLGYMTFLDAILISTFIISALVIVFNVVLKRLEQTDRPEIAHRIDKFSMWLYPIIYLVTFGIIAFYFFGLS